MKLTQDQVRKTAKLANLNLSEKEESLYSEQLSKILDYIDQLNSVNTENVEPTFNVTGQSNITREDGAIESLTQEEALKNTSNKKDNMFATKGVFEE